MKNAARSAKRPVNLLLDQQLIDDVKASGLNMSAVLDSALRQELARKWLTENAGAFEENRKDIEENGMWSDGLRVP